MNPTPSKPNRWRPKTVFNLLVGLLFSFSALAQPAFLKDGLVAYYPFNGNANDESGNGNNGLIRNAILTKDRHSVQNSAMSFDGSSAFIEIPSTKSLESLGRITVSCWINADNLFPQSGQQGWKSSCIAAKGLRSGEATDWALAIDGNRIRPHIFVNGWNYYDSPGVILKQKWHHIVFSYDGSSTRTYADGIIINEAFRNVGILPSSNLPLYIGAYLPSSLSNKNYFPGLIDEFRIYNRALTDNEVKALYDYESTPPDNSFITNGLVAYYPFNGNANDESGNGYHGVVYNTKSQKDRFGTLSSSIDFNGTDSSVSVPDFKNVTLNDELSFSFWINQNIDSDGREHYIISTTTADSFTTSTSRYWGFDVALMTDQTQKITTGLWVRIFGGIYDQAVSAAKFDYLKAGTWNQVSYSLRGNLAKLYINGVLIGQEWRSEALPYSLSYKPTSLSIGKGVWRPTQGRDGFYKGQLDELRIYNRALSDTEIKTLYDYESTPQPLNPRIASATAQVVNGFIVGATITDGGYGYVENPTVTVTGGGGNGAKATAFQVNGVVTSITITNPGSGYTSAPTITIAPPPFPPKKATATSQVVNGFVVGTRITDAGFGYDAPPSVLLVGGGGTGATATATVLNGVVTAITITNPGSGYTSAPLVRIASPPFTPKLAIEVSKVNVRLSVVLGRKYQIESSSDLANWKPASAVFVAQDEELVQEFDVNTTGNYYRINQVP